MEKIQRVYVIMVQNLLKAEETGGSYIMYIRNKSACGLNQTGSVLDIML